MNWVRDVTAAKRIRPRAGRGLIACAAFVAAVLAFGAVAADPGTPAGNQRLDSVVSMVDSDSFKAAETAYRKAIMLDPQGYIESWNAGAERIKGYKADEIIGKHFSK